MVVVASVTLVVALAAFAAAERLPSPDRRRLRGMFPATVTAVSVACLVVETLAIIDVDRSAAVVVGLAGLVLAWAARRRWYAARSNAEALRIRLHRLEARRRRHGR